MACPSKNLSSSAASVAQRRVQNCANRTPKTKVILHPLEEERKRRRDFSPAQTLCAYDKTAKRGCLHAACKRDTRVHTVYAHTESG
eukprot:2152990-Rhodomonas_salina.1